MEGLGPLLDTDTEKLLDMYRINVVGPLAVTQALSESLIAARGCVVNIGSVGVYGLPFHGVYASSKVCPLSSACCQPKALTTGGYADLERCPS